MCSDKSRHPRVSSASPGHPLPGASVGKASEMVLDLDLHSRGSRSPHGLSGPQSCAPQRPKGPSRKRRAPRSALLSDNCIGEGSLRKPGLSTSKLARLGKPFRAQDPGAPAFEAIFLTLLQNRRHRARGRAEEANSPSKATATNQRLGCTVTAEPSAAGGCETVESSKNRKSCSSYLN